MCIVTNYGFAGRPESVEQGLLHIILSRSRPTQGIPRMYGAEGVGIDMCSSGPGLARATLIFGIPGLDNAKKPSRGGLKGTGADGAGGREHRTPHQLRLSQTVVC